MAKIKQNIDEQIIPESIPVDNWNEFREFVEANGNKYVRARWPNPKSNMIHTLWSGIPVDNCSEAQLMTAHGKWIDF